LSNVKFVLELKRRKMFKWLNGILYKSMQGRGKALIINGIWIQNVGMQKWNCICSIIYNNYPLINWSLSSTGKKWKLVQFAIIFNLLSKVKPMIAHEDFLFLFQFLKLWFISKKNGLIGLARKWQNTLKMGWEKPLKLLSKMPNLYF
jgi:hypothetical protein